MRKAINILFLCFCFMQFLSAADTLKPFAQDSDLINQLKTNKVRLLVMREPESLNHALKIISSVDSILYNLTLTGLSQLMQVRKEVNSQNISKIYCSPMHRCQQAAQILRTRMLIPLYSLATDQRLTIQNFGSYDKMSYQTYKGLFTGLPNMLETDIKGIELGSAVNKRTQDFLWFIAKKHKNETILILTHAFNCCHISKTLKDEYGHFPELASYTLYDFSN